MAHTDKENPPLFSQADLDKGAEMGRSWLSETALQAILRVTEESLAGFGQNGIQKTSGAIC